MVIVLNYYELLGMATSKNLTVLEKQIAFISGRPVKIVINSINNLYVVLHGH